MRSACLWITLATAVVGVGGCNPAQPRERDAAPKEAVEPSPVVEPAPVSAPITTTINEFLGRGVPTYVLGTAGDDAADRAIAMQVELIRGLLFPDAKVVSDAAIDREAWPDNPVVYGGPHVSALLAELELPFELAAGRLVIGGQTFEGDGHQLIAVVPASEHHPEFLLYAGTGTPGIAEINGIRHGPESILVIDAFGRLATGSWVRTVDGLAANMAASARRIEWRTSERAVADVAVRFAFPKQLAPEQDEAEQIEAMTRGIADAVERLQIRGPMSIDVYVYPDRRSKQSLTGNEGDGHAVPMARALHVLRHDPAPGGALERLVAHEGTHVLAYESWGPAGTVLLGEGLAVSVSGQYGGVTLEQWAQRLDAAPPITELLGPGFRNRPEAETYPIAGLLVAAAIERVGLEQVRMHLYRATAEDWAAACERAGTSADALAEAVAK